MTALLYWRGRLQAGEPLHHQAERPQGADVRFRSGQGPNGWPHALAKQKLYDDYIWWFNAVYSKPFLDTVYYQDHPEKLPKPMDRLAFFSVMQPLVNPLDTEPRTYPVKVQTFFEGKYLAVKRSRSFYRLASLEEHKVAFSLHTGIPVGHAIGVYDAREVAFLAAEQKRIG